MQENATKELHRAPLVDKSEAKRRGWVPLNILSEEPFEW